MKPVIPGSPTRKRLQSACDRRVPTALVRAEHLRDFSLVEPRRVMGRRFRHSWDGCFDCEAVADDYVGRNHDCCTETGIVNLACLFTLPSPPNPGSSGWTRARRHTGGMNYALMDGHAKWLVGQSRNIIAIRTASRPVRPWHPSSAIGRTRPPSSRHEPGSNRGSADAAQRQADQGCDRPTGRVRHRHRIFRLDTKLFS